MDEAAMTKSGMAVLSIEREYASHGREFDAKPRLG